MYSAFAAAQIISTQWMSIVSDKHGRRVAFLLSFLGSVVGFFIQGVAWDVWSLLVARFLAGLFSGSAPVAMAYVLVHRQANMLRLALPDVVVDVGCETATSQMFVRRQSGRSGWLGM